MSLTSFCRFWSTFLIVINTLLISTPVFAGQKLSPQIQKYIASNLTTPCNSPEKLTLIGGVICKNTALLAMEKQLSTNYTARINDLSDQSQKALLRTQQIIWLDQREQNCSNHHQHSTCIQNLTQERIDALSNRYGILKNPTIRIADNPLGTFDLRVAYTWEAQKSRYHGILTWKSSLGFNQYAHIHGCTDGELSPVKTWLNKHVSVEVLDKEAPLVAIHYDKSCKSDDRRQNVILLSQRCTTDVPSPLLTLKNDQGETHIIYHHNVMLPDQEVLLVPADMTLKSHHRIASSALDPNLIRNTAHTYTPTEQVLSALLNQDKELWNDFLKKHGEAWFEGEDNTHILSHILHQPFTQNYAELLLQDSQTMKQIIPTPRINCSIAQ